MKPRTLAMMIFSAFLAITMLTACGGAQGRFTSHMNRGTEFFEQENYEKARIEFRNALQILPNDAQGRFMFGRSMERLGKIREAAGMYQGAIDTNPDHAGARAALGRVFVFAGAPQKALELVEPGLAKHPTDPELLTVRAAARAQLRQDDGALADAEQAVKLAPTNENAVALLASLYRQRADAPRAIDLLRTTLDKAPKAGELRQVLALLYTSLGDKVGAEQELRKLVELKPADVKARYQLAIFLSGDKRIDDAEKVLKDAIESAPDSDEPKLVYADFLAGQRDPSRGIEALKGYMKSSPDDFDLALGLGALQQRLNQNADALVTYQSVVANAGKKPQALVARNRIAAEYVAHGKRPEARALIDEVLKENPRDNDALLLRSDLALSGNDPGTAIGDLRAVLRDQPDAVPVLRALARAHIANNEPALAEETLQRAVALSPGDAELRIELAQFFAQNGKVDQALPLGEQTVRDNPTNVIAREALVRLYIQKRDFAAARVAAEDLKTLAPEKAVGPYLAGIVAQADSRIDDARKNYQHALELQPDAADALAALMRLELGTGRQAEARKLVESVVAHSPDNMVARNLHGELLLTSKEIVPARAEFEKVIAGAPRWTLGYRNLALAQMAAKDDAGAAATLERGLVGAGQDFSLVADLAALYERSGKPEKAIEKYERLVQSGKQPAAENNLAMLLVTYRNDQKSLDRARELTAGFANSPNAALLDTHGWVLYRNGQYAQALSALERARQMTPESPVVRYHLGMAQLKSGQSAQARENLQGAVEGKRAFAGVEEARAVLASLSSKG